MTTKTAWTYKPSWLLNFETDAERALETPICKVTNLKKYLIVTLAHIQQ